MNIQTAHPKNFYVNRLTTTTDNIMAIADKEVDALYGEIKTRQLTPTGKTEFIYHNWSKDQPFVIEIAVPVEEKACPPNERFELVQRDAFKHLSYTHKGSFEEIEAVYNKLFAELGFKGLKYSGEVREVYTTFIHPTSAENITEIQIGLE